MVLVLDRIPELQYLPLIGHITSVGGHHDTLRRLSLTERQRFSQVDHQIAQIVVLQIDDLNRRLASRRIRLELTAEATRFLAEQGYDPAYGARPLKRVVQRLMENPLAQDMLSGVFAEGDVIGVDVDATRSILVFRKVDVAAAEPAQIEAGG